MKERLEERLNSLKSEYHSRLNVAREKYFSALNAEEFFDRVSKQRTAKNLMAEAFCHLCGYGTNPSLDGALISFLDLLALDRIAKESAASEIVSPNDIFRAKVVASICYFKNDDIRNAKVLLENLTPQEKEVDLVKDLELAIKECEAEQTVSVTGREELLFPHLECDWEQKDASSECPSGSVKAANSEGTPMSANKRARVK